MVAFLPIKTWRHASLTINTFILIVAGEIFSMFTRHNIALMVAAWLRSAHGLHNETGRQ